jgi:hypothetical protein
VCRQAQEENSVEFCNLKKNPLKDLHRVTEHPERLSNRLLEQRSARRASILHLRRKEEGFISLEV